MGVPRVEFFSKAKRKRQYARYKEARIAARRAA